MTAPVAAPAGRATPGPTSSGGATDSAAPFASALDGALAGGRGPVRDATCGGGQQSPGEQAGGTDGQVPEEPTAAPAVDATAASVAATLWALALAGGAAATPGAVAADAVAPGTPGVATPGLPAVGAVAPGAVAVGTVAAGEAAVPAAPVAGAAPAVVPAAAGAVPAVATAAGQPGSPAATAPGTVPAGTAATGASPAVAAPLTGQATRTAAELTVLTAVPAVGADGPPTPTGTTVGPEAATAGAPTPLGLAVPTPGQDAGAGDGPSAQEPAVAPSAPVDGADAADAETAFAPLSSVSASPAGTVTASAAAAGPDAATGTGASQPVSGQVSRQVALLSSAGNGSHTMTLVLTPENLGPVEVQVTVNQGSLDLQLRGAHDMGRAALIDALPELRRDLEAAGLSPSRVEVDADTGGSWLAKHAAEQQAQQHSGDRAARPDQAGERSRSGGRAADSGEGPTRPTNRSTSSGVDVRV